MNTEMKTVNRFAEAGFDGGQAKSMAAGIDGLLDKSMAAFDRRFDALESSLRSLQNFQVISLISIAAAMLAGFAGLLFAVLSRS